MRRCSRQSSRCQAPKLYLRSPIESPTTVVMISVKSYIADVTRGLTELQRTVIPRVTQQALNKTGEAVRSRTQSDLAEEMKLRAKSALKQIVVIHKAVRLSGQVEVTVSDRKGLGLEATENTTVQVFFRGKGKSKRQVSQVFFKGKQLDGTFRIKQIGSLKKGIFKKGEGRYPSGNQRVTRLFTYQATQEFFHAKIDRIQDRIAPRRFEKEFDAALANELRKRGF
ncbi:phage tail protein [Luteolibacter luteus]|uniref:Uncharacterized protein n=1 Tax=Luteolibacter luteus TaxID=2728835 RepID=A0A858RNJ1_9BACT|nr:phage tail protein [Luteolibacter luteus]QJE97998.1 hypothetical protein HHL09_20130 [Luteolibacter luteus]